MRRAVVCNPIWNFSDFGFAMGIRPISDSPAFGGKFVRYVNTLAELTTPGSARRGVWVGATISVTILRFGDK